MSDQDVFVIGSKVLFRDEEIRNDYGVMTIEQIRGDRAKLDKLMGLFPLENLIFADDRVLNSQPSIPINPKTNQPYFEIKPEGWGDGWKAGEVSEFDFIDDKLVPVKPK